MAHYPNEIEQRLPEPFDMHHAATPLAWGTGLIIAGELIVRGVDNVFADLGGYAMGASGVGLWIATGAYASIVAHRRRNIARQITMPLE